MRKFLTIFIIAATLACSAQSNLKAFIQADKPTYLHSEKVITAVKIINNSSKLSILLSDKFTKCFTIVNPLGKKMQPKIEHFTGSKIFLFPGDSLIHFEDIGTLFGIIIPKNEDQKVGLLKGEYAISFKYKDEDVDFKSNEININIISPPPEEKANFDLLNKAVFEELKRKNWKAAYRLYSKIFSENAQSAYAPVALYLSTFVDEQPNNIKVWEQLLNKYPESPQNRFGLPSLLDVFKNEKNKAGVENYLQNLIQQYPKTFVGKYAKRELDKIQSESFEEWLDPRLAIERRLKEYHEKHNRVK